jgi:hypothetical protein
MSREPLDYFTPPVEDGPTARLRVVRRVRRVFGFVALAAFVFAGFNSSDRNPLQWPATFVFMGCLGVYLVAVLVSWAARGVVAVNRRQRCMKM